MMIRPCTNWALSLLVLLECFLLMTVAWTSATGRRKSASYGPKPEKTSFNVFHELPNKRYFMKTINTVSIIEMYAFWTTFLFCMHDHESGPLLNSVCIV